MKKTTPDIVAIYHKNPKVKVSDVLTGFCRAPKFCDGHTDRYTLSVSNSTEIENMGQSIQEWTKQNLWKTALQNFKGYGLPKATCLKLLGLFLNTFSHIVHNVNPHKTEGSYALVHESDILLVGFSSNLLK